MEELGELISWGWKNMLPGLLIPLFFILFILPVQLEISYRRKGKDDNFQLEIYFLFNFFILRLKIPYLQNTFLNFIAEFISEMDKVFLRIWPWKDESQLEEELKGKELELNRVKKAFKFLAEQELLKLIISSLKIKSPLFSWKTKVGWKDPAVTAIIFGLIWTLKGSFLGFINQKITFLKKPQLDVQADFYQQSFESSFKGIFSTTLGNIILTIIRVIFYKIKGGFASWQNIQLKN